MSFLPSRIESIPPFRFCPKMFFFSRKNPSWTLETGHQKLKFPFSTRVADNLVFFQWKFHGSRNLATPTVQKIHRFYSTPPVRASLSGVTVGWVDWIPWMCFCWIISFSTRLLPRKLTWNLKNGPWKRRFLLETIIFRGYVSFQGVYWNIHVQKNGGYQLFRGKLRILSFGRNSS